MDAEKELISSKSIQGTSQLNHVATFRIGGMTCGACVETIERMLRQQEGIQSVTVALLAEKAVVEYDGQKWTPEKIAEEIEDIGFEAEQLPEEIQDVQTLKVYGMTCASCTSTVEREISAMDGVISCVVSLATEEARVEFEKDKVGIRDIVERIEDLGFDAMLSDDRDKTQLESLGRIREVSEWRRAFFISLSFALPNFFLNMIAPKWSFLRPILMWQPISNLYFADVLSLCLATPVQFGIGKRFYISSIKALRHYSATMDVLVVFGTTASFFFSTFSMIVALFCTTQCERPATFFETSTMLITFVTLGRYLENSAKGKTSEALSKLISLTPSMAVIYSDGEKMTQERKVATELIQRGDYVKVIPGERIAADGLVVRGESSVDESMVTGEAIPVTKVIGSAVIGGTVNSLGTFDFVVTRAGKETSLSQIVRLVSDAQTSKAPIQAFADRVAGVFVPCVVGLGVITFIFWMCISHTFQLPSLPDIFQHEGSSRTMVCLKLCISVVVVACPCALGLSTPTAVMVGTGVGAQNGILIKGGGPLEASKTISHILFDKTGTLTQGRLSVAGVRWFDGNLEQPKETSDKVERHALDVQSVSGLKRAEALEILAAAERKSEHPIARGIANFIDSTIGTTLQTDVSNFISVPGHGIQCTVTVQSIPHAIFIGNQNYIDSQKKVLDSTSLAYAEQQSSQGKTLVFAMIDGSLACIISLSDQIKPEARQCIDGLRRMGIHCGIMTGDSQATARAIAKQLDIDEEDVHAEMSPTGKREVIIRLREELAQNNSNKSNGVAMVGDGINDSPALAAATLGIAVGNGAEIAVEAASIVLMRSNLLDVAASLHLSRRIFRQIKLNYVWATGYNIIFIPLAMGFGLPWGIHLHPMMAGAAMAFSSVSVVLSSLTLKTWKRPSWLESTNESEGIDASFELPMQSTSASHLYTLVYSPVQSTFQGIYNIIRPSKPKHQTTGYESLPMETV